MLSAKVWRALCGLFDTEPKSLTDDYQSTDYE